MNKRILLITHNDLFSNPRGGEYSIRTTIEYLKNFGYHIYILSTPKASHITHGKYSIKGFNINYVKVIEKNIILNEAKSNDIDIMLTWGNMIKPTFEASIITGIPFSVWSKSLYYFMPEKEAKQKDIYKDKVPKKIIKKYKPIFLKAKNIWGNCQFVSDMFKKWYGINIGLNYVPVKPDIDQKEKGEYILLPLKEKIDFDFIKSIASKFPKEKFLIPSRKLKDVGVYRNIEVIKFINKKELWNKIKLMLYPKSLLSEYGTSRTIIEALQMGVPVIGNGATGIEEMPIVKANHNIADYCKKINKVINDYEYYSKKSKKQIYEKYDYRIECEKVRKDIHNVVVYSKKHINLYINLKINNGFSI